MPHDLFKDEFKRLVQEGRRPWLVLVPDCELMDEAKRWARLGSCPSMNPGGHVYRFGVRLHTISGMERAVAGLRSDQGAFLCKTSLVVMEPMVLKDLMNWLDNRVHATGAL